MKPHTQMTDNQRKTLISTMWIFVLLNMVYADILGMLRPGYLEFLQRVSQQLTGITVLFFAILMEIADRDGFAFSNFKLQSKSLDTFYCCSSDHFMGHSAFVNAFTWG